MSGRAGSGFFFSGGILAGLPLFVKAEITSILLASFLVLIVCNKVLSRSIAETFEYNAYYISIRLVTISS